MTCNTGKGYKDLRVRDLEEEVHLRIERWRDMHNLRTGSGLDKSDAAKILLDKATKHIKIPTQLEQ
jgi:hypothetical protein